MLWRYLGTTPRMIAKSGIGNQNLNLKKVLTVNPVLRTVGQIAGRA